LIRDIPFNRADGASMRGAVASDGCVLSAASTAVRDAYWYASQLIGVGWTIRRIGATEQGGFFIAETPRRRVVLIDECCASRSSLAAHFARSVGSLAAASETDGHDYLHQLVRLLLDNAPSRRPATLLWRTRNIPDLPAHLQPIAQIRAAYWFAVTLIDDYGWKLFEIGRDTAAGGFIADIPGETVAVYPASMRDDHTVASALARLLGSMDANKAVIVDALVVRHTSAG
jgi:hypothetical protein